LNDDLVGFANTTSRDMLDNLFLSYDSITAVDIEQNFENMGFYWSSAETFICLLQNFQVRKIQQCLPQMG
jgi:hypothetical protein